MRNKADLLGDHLCGCFHFMETFSPMEIQDWIREKDGTETAICPKCGIDSVLGSAFPVTDEHFLAEMHLYWF
ncbi:hypothetical protein G6047_12550 [Flavobacterium sp. SE-s28]|uniref:Cytoplasmic protein n=2 Tax=Flavobacterium silvaticum TaxID=1852020 RepID=A0A972G1R6_9FLAO|nr:hypothetical protein [Flavobacterium silvaticum]